MRTIHLGLCRPHVCGLILDWFLLNPSCTNKRYFKNLGFSKNDFHTITWLTSWALSGTHEHELPDCSTSETRESLPARYFYNLPKSCITYTLTTKTFRGVWKILTVFATHENHHNIVENPCEHPLNLAWKGISCTFAMLQCLQCWAQFEQVRASQANELCEGILEL